MENYKNAIKVALFRESYEGKRLGIFMGILDMISSRLLEEHKEETCCSEYSRNFEFQCPSNRVEPVIATYNSGNYAHLWMKEVEQFVLFTGSESAMNESVFYFIL